MVTSDNGKAQVNAPKGRVEATVAQFLSGRDFDDAGEALASIAMALAIKLDQSLRETANGAVAQAVAPVSKQLRETIAELIEISSDPEGMIADIFGRSDA